MDYNITYRKKDGSIQYIISYKVDGTWKQKSKQGFAKMKDAKQAAEKRLDELKKEVALAAQVEPEYVGITFGDFAAEIIAHERLHKTASTVKNREAAVEKFRDLKDIPLAELKNRDFQRCVDCMVRDGLKISTIKEYLRRISYIMNQAVRPYKIIATSPMEDITLPLMQYDNENPIKALEQSEIAQLLALLKSKDTYLKYYYLCAFALATGLRRGELLGLTWDDVDFKNSEIHVVRQWKLLKNGKEGFGTLKKANSKRIVPVSKGTLENLKEYRSIFNVISMDNRVFPIDNNTLSVKFGRIDKLVDFKISVHILRHTYATNLIANGVDFKTAAAILGHNVEMTMKVYSHVTDDMMQRAAEKIEMIF